MGKQKLNELFKKNTLKINSNKVVALSWEEVASPEFAAKGAEAADQSINTAGEKQYLKDFLAKQEQLKIQAQQKIDLEAKEAQEKAHQDLEDKKAEIAKQKAELLSQNKDKKIAVPKDLSGNPIATAVFPQISVNLSPEQKAQYQALTEQENTLTEESAKAAFLLKNNPETQKKIDYANKQKEKFFWKPTTYVPAKNPFISPLTQGSFNFVSGLVTELANWTDTFVTNTANSFVDEDQEVNKRASLPKNHPDYIDKKEYYEGKKLSEKVDTSLIRNSVLVHYKELEKLEKTLPSKKVSNLSIFSSERINHTFLKNRIERTLENLNAALEKKSGVDNFVEEIFGKTTINPGAHISFLENVRSNQYDFFWGQDAEENLNERLASKAKEKKLKDLSQLSEKDFMEVYDQLDPVEKLTIESKYTKLVADSLAEDHLSSSYKLVKNTGSSADFIVSLLLTRGAGKLLGYGVKAAFPALTGASTTEGNLIARTLLNKGVSAKTAEAVAKSTGTFAKVIGEGTAITYVNPSELVGPRYSKYKSIDDKEGNVKAVFSREGAYALVKKETERDREAYTKVYNHLKSQESFLNEEQKNVLNFLSGSLGYKENATYINDKGETVPVESLDDKLKSYEVNSKAYIHFRGALSNIIETGTEVYTGKAIKAFGNGAKVLAEKVPFANKVLVSASGKIDNLEKWYATTKLGKVKRDFDFVTNKYFGIKQDVIQSVPEEIVEEYAAAAANSLVDWDSTEIKQALTMDFLGEVSAQTLLLNGTMKGLGIVPGVSKMLYGSLYDRKVEKMDKEIKRLETLLKNNPEDTNTLNALNKLKEDKQKTEETASLTGLGLSKKINKNHDAYSNTRKYLEKNAGIRRAISSLKAANTDEDLNKILDLLDTTNSNDEARIRESFVLRQTGKVAEAEAIEAAMDSSTIMNAIYTNNAKDLQGTLEKVLKDSSRNITADQKQRLTNLSENLNEIVKFREDNKDTKGNLQLATVLKAKQLSSKKAKEVILNQRASIAESAIKDFENLFDQYFSNSNLNKTEAIQAFINGTLIDKAEFDPIVEKANVLDLKSFIGYTSSFLKEESLIDSLNSLDLAIAETLNPPTHLIERDAFNEEFIQKFNDLYQGNLSDLSDLGIAEVTFDKNQKIVFTPKIANEILEKLSEKYIRENRLTKQQMAEIKLKNKNLMEAYLSQQDKQAKRVEALEKLMQKNLETPSEENLESAPETITVVDADAFAETQEFLKENIVEVISEVEITPVVVSSTIEAKKADIEKELFSETDNKGRTFTYYSTTKEKDGKITIKFLFNRSDKNSSQRATVVTGIPVEKALGDKYTIDETYIPEGAKVVGVSEIRVTKKGAGATVTFEVNGEKYQGEVKLNSNTTYDAELAALENNTETSSTQNFNTPTSTFTMEEQKADIERRLENFGSNIAKRKFQITKLIDRKAVEQDEKLVAEKNKKRRDLLKELEQMSYEEFANLTPDERERFGIDRLSKVSEETRQKQIIALDNDDVSFELSKQKKRLSKEIQEVLVSIESFREINIVKNQWNLTKEKEYRELVNQIKKLLELEGIKIVEANIGDSFENTFITKDEEGKTVTLAEVVEFYGIKEYSDTIVEIIRPSFIDIDTGSQLVAGEVIVAEEISYVSERTKMLQEITAKYDAELAALERNKTFIEVSQDSLIDEEEEDRDTDVEKGKNQYDIPDLSIDFSKEDTEKIESILENNEKIYLKILDKFLPSFSIAIGGENIDPVFLLEEFINISTPKELEYISVSTGGYIRACKKRGITVTDAQVAQIYKMAKAKFSPDLLSAYHSIFETVLTDNEVTPATEYDTLSEQVNKEVTEIEEDVKPVVTLTSKEIKEAPLNLEDLEAQKLENLKQEILAGKHPLSAKVLELTNFGVDFWEAYNAALNGVTEDTVVAKEDTTSYFTPFLGFNALPYEWYTYTDEKGIERLAKRTTEKAQLNVSQNDRFIRPDFRDLLHPDKYVTGSEFNIEVSKEEDWDNIIYQEITSDTEVTLPNGKVLPAGTKTIVSFADFMKTKPSSFRNSEEFKGVVPIFITDASGKRLAYIHTLDWYTPNSIPNPNPKDESTSLEPSEEWLEHIEKHKEGTKRLREAISKGLTKISIEKPAEGKAGMLVSSETRISVQESNPQAILTVQRGGTMRDFLNGLIKKDPEFATQTKVLVNDPKEFTPQINNKTGETVNPDGHTWAIYRVGSKLHPTKPGVIVKTYRAIRLGRHIDESQIENARWAIAAHKVLNGKLSKPGYELTLEEARKIAQGVNASLGLDLSKFTDLGSFIRMFFKIEKSYIQEYQNKVNEGREKDKQVRYDVRSTAPYIEYLFDRDIPSLELISGLNDRGDRKPVISQHTNDEMLLAKGLGAVPRITNDRLDPVQPYTNAEGKPLSYEEYLKDTLYTNYKAFDMDSTGKAPAYSLTVQPKILINYNNEDIDSNKAIQAPVEISLEEKIENAVKDSLKEIETTPTLLSEEDKIKGLSEINSLLRQYKIDYNLFLEGDDSVGSLEELRPLFDLTGNLTVNQQKAILGLITSEINSLLGFKAKINSKTVNRIKNEVKSTLNLKLKNRLSKLEEAKKFIVSNNIETPEAAAMVRAIDNSIQNIVDIQKQYDTLFATALKNALIETRVTEIEEQEDLEETELEKEKNFSKESVEEKLKDKASSQIRMLMHSIPMFNDAGEVVTGYLDLPSYMSLNDTYNLVLRTVSANIDARADFKEIMDKLSKSEHPAIKMIIARLEGADQQVKNQFVYNITAHALSSKFVMYENKKGKVSLKLYDTNSSQINRQIKQKWVENSKFTELYHEDGSFNTVYAQKLINEFESFGVNPAEAPEEKLRAWLGKLGIVLHNKTWEKLYTQGYKQGDTVTSFYTLVTHKKLGLYPNLISFLQKGIADTEGNYRANTPNDILSEIGKISNTIALIEADYNPELVSLSYQDNGKSIFTLTPPKYITERVTSLIKRIVDSETGLSKASDLVSDLLEISYNKNSMILQLLKENPEMSELLAVHHVSLGAIKDKDKKDSQGKITELSALDYDMFALGGLQDRRVQTFSTKQMFGGIPLRIANMLSSTKSDKDAGLFMTVPVLDLLKDANFSFYKDENGELKMTDKLLSVLIELVVRPELERIINFNKNVKKTGIKNYDIAARTFHFIPALNSLQIKGKNLIEYLNSEDSITETTEEVLQTINVELKDRLQRVITAEAREKTEAWKELGLVSKGKSEKLQNKIFNEEYFTEKGIEKDPVKDFDLGVMDFVINSFVFQAEYVKVFSGDIAQFSQDKVWKKAIEKASNRDKVQHTPFTLTTEDYIKINKEIGTNLGKRLAYEIAPGKQGIVTEENRFYNQIFLQDTVDIAENTLDLIEMYEGLEARKNSKEDVVKYKFLKKALGELEDKTSLSEKEILTKEYILEELENIRKTLAKNYPSLADYFNIESTDAQEYTTVTEHLQILNSIGRISKDQYNKIITALASNSPLDEADLKLIMQPIKPMHGGSYIVKEADVERVIYIKSSSFPLIPELTKGTSLDKLRIAMERLESETGRFTRASYQSANKVGAVVNPINPLDALSLETLFNYKNNANTDPTSPILVLDRNNFRIQQDVPFKSGKAKADTNAMGTQIFKMLFSNGIVSSENTFIYKGKPVNGKELYEIYENTFSKIIDHETTKLYKDLGLDSQGKVLDQKIFMSKLKDVLVEEAVNRGYSLREVRNLQLVELIDINSQETYYDFKTPLWLSSNSNKYEALLNSIITNRVMQFKMPGNSFIAGSENGFRFSESMSTLSSTEKNKIIYLKGWNGQELQGTHFTEEDGSPVFTAAQVMVSSKIKGANNKLIDLFEGYNSKSGDVSKAKYLKRNPNGTLGLKEDMIDPELLKMFSFRTPTSSHISGSSIEIVGILPPTCGDLMLVPKNFTKQKGLDFDIDKEGAYSFNHYITEEGKAKIIDEEYLKAVLKGDIRVSLINTPEFDATQYYQKRRTWFSDRKRDLKAIKLLKNAVKNKKIIEKEIQDLTYILSVKQKSKIQDVETISELELLIDQANLDLETINEVILNIEKTSSLKANFSKEKFEAEKNKLIDEYEILFVDLEVAYFKELENQHIQNIEKKIAQNDFTRVYLAVYDSPSKEVQKKLNSILSMEVASEQASKLASWKEEGIKNKFIVSQKKQGKNSQEAEEAYKDYLENFTMLSYSYQKSKMDLGAIGKRAIGVYATAATFAALVQTKYPKGMNMKAFTIGNMSSSKLGALHSLSKKHQRTLSDILGERINTATDNEKEQILGRVGVDDMTIGVDSFLALAGFDLGESGNSISYMLLSQPAVVEFNKKIKESKGIIGKWIDERKLIAEMLEKLTANETETIAYVKNPDKNTWHFIQTNSLGLKKELKGGSEMLTEKVLEEGIKKGAVYGKEQAHALMTYIQARELANRLTPMVSALNTNSLGKSVPEAMLKHAKMGKAMFSERPLFENFISLIGEEVSDPTEGYAFEVMSAEGVPEVHYVKPTTPQGKIAVTGLHLGKTLFENLFVYNDADIKEVINQILNIQEIEEDRVASEDLEFIIQEFKKFLFSNPKLTGNFEDSSLKRYELVQDTPQNESLAKYIHSLFKNTEVKYAKGIEAIKNNPLVGKRLMYKIGKGAEEISTITFNNSSTDSLSDEELYLSLPSLMIDNLQLPPRNGKPYTTQDLVEDLVIYAYLEGGIQKATQFIKFIPIELQSEIGKVNPQTGAFISINDQLQNYNPRRIPISMKKEVFGINELGGFISFFFQNNPTEAPRISYEDATLNVSETTQSLTLTPERKAISTPKIVHFIDRNKNLYLFRHVGAGNYVGMDYNKLSKSISQYSKGGVFESVKGKELQERVLDNLFKDVTHDFKIQESMTLEEALEQVATLPLAKNREYLNQLAALFKLNIDKDKTFSAKVIGSRGRAIKGNVIMDLNYLLNKNTTNELVAETIIHEVIHSLTVKDLDKYFDTNKTTNSYELIPEFATGEFPLPTHVSQLINTYKAFITSSLIDSKRLGTLKEYMKKIKQETIAGENITNYTEELQTMFTPEEFKIYYAATNIKEFMSVLFESASFRQELDKIEYKTSGQTLLEKIADALLKFLNTVFPGLRDNHLAKEALIASLKFMEAERKFSVEVNNSVSLTDDKDLDAKYDSSFSLDKDRSIPESTLEITQEEWESLTEEEKQRIKDCI